MTVHTDISIDFETFSECPLKTEGMYRYARHASTEVLCMAYRVNYGDVHLWWPGDALPAWLVDPDGHNVRFRAWNALFEYNIIRHVMRLNPGPLSIWYDTMAKAMSMALPASLDKCAKAMSLPDELQKDKRGTYLIQRLCQLYKGQRNMDPVLMKELGAYCKQDVVAESTVDQRLPDMTEHEREIWLLDSLINWRGIPIDTFNCRHAVAMFEDVKEDLDRQLRDLTWLDNPNSNAQMMAWLKGEGVEIGNLQAPTIDKLLKNDALLRVNDGDF